MTYKNGDLLMALTAIAKSPVHHVAIARKFIARATEEAVNEAFVER